MKTVHYFAAALFFTAPLFSADIGRISGTVAGSMAVDPLDDGPKGYWETLEERRSIPKSRQEYLQKRDQTLDMGHEYELKSPGTGRPAYMLQKVLHYGWADSWSKRNPGWHDFLIATSPFAVCLVMIAAVVAFAPPPRRRGDNL